MSAPGALDDAADLDLDPRVELELVLRLEVLVDVQCERAAGGGECEHEGGEQDEDAGAHYEGSSVGGVWKGRTAIEAAK